MSRTIDLEAQIDQLRRTNRTTRAPETQSSPTDSPANPAASIEPLPSQLTVTITPQPLIERKPMLRGLLALFICSTAIWGGWSLGKVDPRARTPQPIEPLPWQNAGTKPSAARAMDPQIEKLRSGLASAEDQLRQMEKQLAEEKRKRQPLMTENRVSKEAQTLLNEQLKEWQASYAKLEASLSEQYAQVQKLQHELNKARFEQVQHLLVENKAVVAGATAILEQRDALAAAKKEAAPKPARQVPVSVSRRPNTYQVSEAGRLTAAKKEAPAPLFRAAQF